MAAERRAVRVRRRVHRHCADRATPKMGLNGLSRSTLAEVGVLRCVGSLFVLCFRLPVSLAPKAGSRKNQNLYVGERGFHQSDYQRCRNHLATGSQLHWTVEPESAVRDDVKKEGGAVRNVS